MYNIGDDVKINMSRVNEKYKKYKGVYKIIKIIRTAAGINLYKLKGVPGYGTKDMIILVKPI